MAHIDQLKFVKAFKEFYLKNNFSKDINALEIGSYDVNGSIKQEFDFTKRYIGIDLINGPNVDVVLDGSQIDKMNQKFDMILSFECFEHAKNWKIIFKKIYNILNINSFVVLSMASTGRVEHGTSRSGQWQSPGTSDEYYKNLTKKDFLCFDLDNMFSSYFFFYNVNSFDLYFVGIKGHKAKHKLLNHLNQNLYKIFKKKKIRKQLQYIYTIIVGETFKQNFYFFRKKICFLLISFFK